jgi:hypothetical protein
MNHPDAQMDSEIFMNMMREELGPVIKVLVGRIEQLENANQELNKMVTGIVSGFGDALTNHRRTGLA